MENELITIDKGHEAYSPYRSKCSDCKYFNLSGLNCNAFPNVIPNMFLSGEKTHDTIIDGQTGTYTFTQKKEAASISDSFKLHD